jgi:two-component system response regulator ArlR
MSTKDRILIVEDEKKIARFLQLELEHEGYECVLEYCGSPALDRIGQEHIDLVLLDVMLPDMDGLVVCQQIRKVSMVPVMILSAKDDVETKVKGLDLGANDYMTKPFNSKELFARIRALLRKKQAQRTVENTLKLQDLILYLDRHEVICNNKPIPLTKKEFELLTYMIRNRGIVLTRERILEEVWGYDYIGDTNVVDVYIRYIRSKVDEVLGKKYIYTVRGIGYVAKD